MLKNYVVDAFTNKIFTGNPAAVIFLDEFLEKEFMQKLAVENRFSETAFAVKQDDTHYKLRWFTPGGEIDLCGHATLATGYLVFRYDAPKNSDTVFFETLSGELSVTKVNNLYQMSFPSYQLKQIAVTDEMSQAFGMTPIEAYVGRDLLCVFSDGTDLTRLTPNYSKLGQLEGLLQHATTTSKNYDCESRSFAPKLDVPEDPVCGSGHCHIVPYWAKRLNKKKITAYQASTRSGILYCEYQNSRTLLSGEAVQYAVSELNIQI